MSFKRSIPHMVGILAGMLVSVVAAGPAYAAVQPTQHASLGVLTAPAAPVQTKSTSTQPTMLAVSPTISPSVDTSHVFPGQTYRCSRGTLCTQVWDSTTANWKIFRLSSCRLYTLSHWENIGLYYDNQTGGVTSYFYDQNFNVLKSFRPDATQHNYNWTPVSYIRNCF
jgi:hypothetical protein